MKAKPSTEDKSADEPTFIAQCPECECLCGCVVVVCDDDDNLNWMDDDRLADALELRAEWKRDGYKVSTVRVRDVRNWPKGKAFKHSAGCFRDKRRKYRKRGEVQAATPLLSGL